MGHNGKPTPRAIEEQGIPRSWIPTEKQLLLPDGSVDVRAQLARWDDDYNAHAGPMRPRPEDALR